MKKILSMAAVLLLSTTIITSCDKEEDEGKLPNISLKTGSSYVSADTTVNTTTAVMMGIDASKSEPNDVLTQFTATVSFDGGADSTWYTEALTGTAGNTYSKDLPVITRGVAGTEKYTFTVVNKDGLVNKKSITLTVQ